MSKPESLINHFVETENIITELEAHVEELSASRLEWKTKYYKLKVRFDDIDFNKGELEQLKIENGKLQVELNTVRKNKKTEGQLAMEKLKEIERILKYKQ